jgi:hypothetical protein
VCVIKELPIAGYSVVKEPGARVQAPGPRKFLAGRVARLVASVRTPAGGDGGEYRARTGDLLVANQALSQLS